MNNLTSKTCEFCLSEINSLAKRCSACGTWQAVALRFFSNQNLYGSVIKNSFWFVVFVFFLVLAGFGTFKNKQATYDKNIFNNISVSVPEMKYNEEGKKYWIGYSEIKNNSNKEIRNIEIKFYAYGQDKKIWDITDRDVYETLKPGESTTIEVYIPKRTGFEEIKWVTPQIKRIFIKPIFQFKK